MRPRLDMVLMSPINITAPVMKAADPIPAINLNNIRSSKESTSPAIPLPNAAINGPTTRGSLLPYRCANMAVGILVMNLAKPKTLITKPTVATDTPNESAYKGRIGATMPCPEVSKAVETQRSIMVGFSLRIVNNCNCNSSSFVYTVIMTTTSIRYN